MQQLEGMVAQAQLLKTAAGNPAAALVSPHLQRQQRGPGVAVQIVAAVSVPVPEPIATSPDSTRQLEIAASPDSTEQLEVAKARLAQLLQC